MAGPSSYLVNKYARTLGKKTSTFLDRITMEKGKADDWDDAAMGALKAGGQAIGGGIGQFRDYKLAAAGGYEGGFLEFLKDPARAATAMKKGEVVAREHGMKAVWRGQAKMGEEGPELVDKKDIKNFFEKWVGAHKKSDSPNLRDDWYRRNTGTTWETGHGILKGRRKGDY